MTRGSCLCGTVRWEAEAPFTRMRHCHCSMCRKAHGAPFATYISVARERYRLVAGATDITGYQSSAQYHRAFCSICGSVAPSMENDGNVDMPAGCLDDDPGIRPTMHIFTGSKAAWDTIADSLPRAEAYEAGNTTLPVPQQHAHRPDSFDALRGSCLCSAVAYEITAPFRVSYHCHCHRCQKARAAAHTTNGSVARDAFHYVRGEELVVHYRVPDAITFTHSFCRICGSGMVRPGGDRPFVTVPLASLDDDPVIRPFNRIYMNYVAPWFTIEDDLPQFGEGPDKRPIAYFQDA
ncbi:MAG: GFA family protein [Alphaproteobacteria bacterium]